MLSPAIHPTYDRSEQNLQSGGEDKKYAGIKSRFNGLGSIYFLGLEQDHIKCLASSSSEDSIEEN